MHDARIFDNSVETRQLNGILLADSGYPCRNYILIPVLQPTLPAQRRYNRSHMATRITVERCFGVLKRRFLCLQQKLRYSSDFCCNIVLACTILHNFIIEKEGLSDEELKEMMIYMMILTWKTVIHKVMLTVMYLFNVIFQTNCKL